MKLARDASCSERRTYRSDLPEWVSPDEVIEALERDHGLVRTRMPPGVIGLRSEDGHVILVVPATRRVQIRVHPEVPLQARYLAAESVFATLVLTVSEMR